MMLEELINIFASKIGFSTQELLRQSFVAFIEKNLQEIKDEISRIQNLYEIKKPSDFEKLYENGIIEEKDSWQDYQLFDHLFYKQEIFEEFLIIFKI